MTKKHTKISKKESKKRAEWLDRRSFLMRAGKYSAAAAGLLAGSNALFGACAKKDDDSDDGDSGIESRGGSGQEDVADSSVQSNEDSGQEGAGGSEQKDAADSKDDLLQEYKESAQPMTLEAGESVSVSADEEIVYSFTIESGGTHYLTISEDSSVEGTISLSLIDETGEVLWSEDAYEGATWSLGDLFLNDHYLVIKSDGGTGEITFTITVSNPEQDAGWNDYSEWTDANPWTNNTWSDSSGWKDAGSGTWVAHSDTWYNGEWNDGWLNYGYY
jgi:hypothetical protein